MSCYHMTLCVYKERMCVRDLSLGFGFSFESFDFSLEVLEPGCKN